MVVGCEQFQHAFWGQPVNTVTSLAFVAAGAAILVTRRRRDRAAERAGAAARSGLRGGFGVLVAAVGVGSFIQHGPHPDWQAYPHDLTLAAVLAFLAVDAASDLTGRRLPAWWWLGATAAVAPMVAIGATAATLAQAGLGMLAIGLNLWRAWRRPHLRQTLIAALAVLAAGALAGTLGDRTPLCQPSSLLQGHAVWHVLAALSLWLVAPVVGALSPDRRPAADPATRAGQS